MEQTDRLTTTDLRKINKNKIFRLIHCKGAVSRQEIADTVGLSLPTINQNLRALEEDGLILYVGNYDSTGGRKAQIIKVNNAARYAVSVSIMPNCIKAALLDFNGNITDTMEHAVKAAGQREYETEVNILIHKMIRKNKIDSSKILGVGITIPGVFDKDNKTLISAPTLGISDYLLENLTRDIKYDCIVINDARAAAFADYWYFNRQLRDAGAAYKNEKVLPMHTGIGKKVYLMLGDGVGGARVDADGIISGRHNICGEFGHMMIHPGGLPCLCGKKGCLEAYVSARRISDELGVDLDTFFEGLREKNKTYKKFFQKYLDNLAIGINNLYIMLDEDIVLNGMVSCYLKDYENDIRKKLIEKCPFDTDGSYFSFSECTAQQSAAGAALMFLSDFISTI